jgi:hypothetical protein
MFDKKIILFTFLALLSITAGGILGLLDIYGFVDGRHELSFSLFALSLFTVYFITITVFLLDFVESGRIAASFIIGALLFGITFFLMNLSIILSVFATLLYFSFLLYIYTASKKKAQNQIKFSPDEIFLPIVRNGTLYLLILVSAIAFTQSRHLIERNSLVKPTLLKTIFKPAVIMLNSQINSQTQQQIKQIPKELKGGQGTQKIVRLILHKTVETMAQNNSSGTIYGLKPEEIRIARSEECGADGISRQRRGIGYAIENRGESALIIIKKISYDKSCIH